MATLTKRAGTMSANAWAQECPIISPTVPTAPWLRVGRALPPLHVWARRPSSLDALDGLPNTAHDTAVELCAASEFVGLCQRWCWIPAAGPGTWAGGWASTHETLRSWVAQLRQEPVQQGGSWHLIRPVR